METCQNIWRPVCKGASGSNLRQATAVYADMEVSHNSSFATLEAHTFNSASVAAHSNGDKLHNFQTSLVPVHNRACYGTPFAKPGYVDVRFGRNQNLVLKIFN